MLKRKLTSSDCFLLFANLLPAYGVLFENWSAWEIFLVYCLETIIIGLFTLIKLGMVTVIKKQDWWQSNGKKSKVHGSFFMLFFIVHYGIFVLVQMGLFFSFSQINTTQSISLLKFLTHPFSYLSKEAWLMLAVFVMGYGYKNINEFILSGKYRTASMGVIMFEPYIRIIIQQFTVLIGALALGFGAASFFMLIFTAVKIYFAVFFNYEGMLQLTLKKQGMGDDHQDNNSSHS